MNDLSIRQAAFHEVCHVFLGSLVACAEARFVTEDEINEAAHSVVRTMENVIFKKEKTNG